MKNEFQLLATSIVDAQFFSKKQVGACIKMLQYQYIQWMKVLLTML